MYYKQIERWETERAVSIALQLLTGHLQARNRFPYGLVVRIPAFHVGGPGSIPGVGTSFFSSRQLF